MPERDPRKVHLISELAHARSALSEKKANVDGALDFKSCIGRSIARNPVAWLGGAVLVGLILSRLPDGRRKVRVKVQRDEIDTGTVAKTGIGMLVAKLAFDAARPALIKFATGQLQPLLGKALERWQNRH